MNYWYLAFALVRVDGADRGDEQLQPRKPERKLERKT